MKTIFAATFDKSYNWIDILIESDDNFHFRVTKTERNKIRLKNVSSHTSEATFDGEAIRWVSNNAVLMEDVVKDYHLDKIPGFSFPTHLAAYEKYTNASLAKYRKAESKRKPSGEELYEMTAAFGFNQVVMNVLTGRKIRTMSRRGVR